MARFHVHADTEAGGYLLDVQATLRDRLATRVVVPLLPLDGAPRAARVLDPTFDIQGVPHMMATQFMASVPGRLLGPKVLDLGEEAAIIVGAPDCLLQGL